MPLDPHAMDAVGGCHRFYCQGQRLWRQNTVWAPPQGPSDHLDFQLNHMALGQNLVALVNIKIAGLC